MSTNTETKTETPAFDYITTEALGQPFTEWNPNLMSVYAHRLEDAFYDKLKGRLEKVQDELDALMNHVLSDASDETRAAVRDEKGDPRIRAAYMLGCLSFAHMFASQVVSRRPDDEFYEEFTDEQTKKILACLVSADSTKVEIAAAAQLAMTTVESKMRKLMGLGITEFRMRFGAGQAGVAEYFLTPAAKQMLAAQQPK